VLDPDQVRIAKTASRHVLGVMNDMVQYAQAVVDTSGRLAACDLERSETGCAAACTSATDST
jgi:hypothetical protein